MDFPTVFKATQEHQKTLSGTTAERVETTDQQKRFRTATVYAYKAFVAGVPTVNVSTIYLGYSSTKMPLVLAPGDSVSLKFDHPGQQMYAMYFKGASGDGLFITWNE